MLLLLVHQGLAHACCCTLLPPTDEYYTDFASLCRQRKTTLTDFCKALVYTGLNDTVNAKGFENTVFVPNNKAFTKLDLGAGKVPPPAKAAEVR